MLHDDPSCLIREFADGVLCAPACNSVEVVLVIEAPGGRQLKLREVSKESWRLNETGKHRILDEDGMMTIKKNTLDVAVHCLWPDYRPVSCRFECLVKAGKSKRINIARCGIFCDELEPLVEKCTRSPRYCVGQVFGPKYVIDSDKLAQLHSDIKTDAAKYANLFSVSYPLGRNNKTTSCCDDDHNAIVVEQ